MGLLTEWTDAARTAHGDQTEISSPSRRAISISVLESSSRHGRSPTANGSMRLSVAARRAQRRSARAGPAGSANSGALPRTSTSLSGFPSPRAQDPKRIARSPRSPPPDPRAGSAGGRLHSPDHPFEHLARLRHLGTGQFGRRGLGQKIGGSPLQLVTVETRQEPPRLFRQRSPSALRQPKPEMSPRRKITAGAAPVRLEHLVQYPGRCHFRHLPRSVQEMPIDDCRCGMAPPWYWGTSQSASPGSSSLNRES